MKTILTLLAITAGFASAETPAKAADATTQPAKATGNTIVVTGSSANANGAKEAAAPAKTEDKCCAKEGAAPIKGYSGGITVSGPTGTTNSTITTGGCCSDAHAGAKAKAEAKAPAAAAKPEEKKAGEKK